MGRGIPARAGRTGMVAVASLVVLAGIAVSGATAARAGGPGTRAGTPATGPGSAGPGAAAARKAVTPLPPRVFAPYFEAWSGDNPVTLSQRSGAKYLSFAFIQTAKKGSCAAYWDGDTSEPLSPATFGSAIASLQSAGGNAIPSFGGYTADTTGTDIADSCTSVASIAKVYENVVTTYNVPRIDLDVEQDSVNDTAGIARRNQAIAQVEAWAKANGRSIQFSYTMPTTTAGLTAAELEVLRSAISCGATISVVNIMTFDYYIGTAQKMAADTESAATALEGQLKSLYPSLTTQRLWAMVGVTEMPGIDDFGAPETFTQPDAATVLGWARGKGIGTLSMWAAERDNGGCPGTAGSNTCSGISQPAWYFSDAFEGFTG